MARAGTGETAIGFPPRLEVSRLGVGITVPEGEDLSGATACAGGFIARGELTSFPTPAIVGLAPMLTERLWGVGETKMDGFIDAARDLSGVVRGGLDAVERERDVLILCVYAPLDRLELADRNEPAMLLGGAGCLVGMAF